MCKRERGLERCSAIPPQAVQPLDADLYSSREALP